ncbi:MAG: hypothetical protein IKH24_08190 [Bacteroidales bacterium]|nr:hypothetical protein [Bacteroidales bacterium]
METIYIIVLFVLTLVFSALWMKEKYGSEDLRTTVGRIDRMLSSIDGKVAQMSVGEADRQGDGPVTKESVLAALRYHHLTIEEPDTEEPDIIYFEYQGVHYRINASKLPFLSMGVGFSIDPEEDDVDLIMQVAQEITYSTYLVKVMVAQEDKFYAYQVDMIADTYLPLRDNLRNYLDLLLDARRQFKDLYGRKREERKQASNEALQTTLLASQLDAAGNKILS